MPFISTTLPFNVDNHPAARKSKVANAITQRLKEDVSFRSVLHLNSKTRCGGDRAEAKVKGWTKYYGGEIIRV